MIRENFDELASATGKEDDPKCSNPLEVLALVKRFGLGTTASPINEAPQSELNHEHKHSLT